MIISHQHKYIFIKPTKVAGTSTEINLAKHCREKDIITLISPFSKNMDDNQYDHSAQNHQRYYNHITPNEIKKKISKEVWQNYLKFTIVRNPWDCVVSAYCHFKRKNERKKTDPSWKKKIYSPIKPSILFRPKSYTFFMKNHVYPTIKGKILKILGFSDFEIFVRTFRDRWNNTKYYFDSKGKPICDFYIRYENLEKDYKKVCQKIGIPYEKMPKAKTKQRDKKIHYSQYYNKRSESIVKNKFKKEINFFGYKFKNE